MERPKLHVTEHTASDTILIVDDDAINRKILGKIFSPFYAVEEAENGRVGTASWRTAGGSAPSSWTC